MTNDLERFFFERASRQISKWDCYFAVYDRYFSRFRGRPITFVEIGVQGGGSLEMWRDYLGPEARIFGVDVVPECKAYEAEGTRVLIGDQEDPAFLAELLEATGPIDGFLDDGGHTMAQQIATFEACFPALREGGVYICEDVHTSYWPPYGGGLRDPRSFVERMKAKVDELNGFHVWGGGETPFTRMASSIAFYDSMVVVERAARERPRNLYARDGVVAEVGS